MKGSQINSMVRAKCNCEVCIKAREEYKKKREKNENRENKD